MNRPRSLWIIALASLLGLVAAACGTAVVPSPTPTATPAQSPNTSTTEIAVSLSDAFAMEPASMTVKAGSTVRFMLTNDGVTEHEFYVGDAAAQDAHEAEMQAGGMRHDEPDGVAVEPGGTKVFEFTFGEPGELLAGCHVAGHYAAGMQARITVVP